MNPFSDEYKVKSPRRTRSPPPFHDDIGYFDCAGMCWTIKHAEDTVNNFNILGMRDELRKLQEDYHALVKTLSTVLAELAALVGKR